MKIGFGAALALALVLAAQTSSARQWNPSQTSLAQEYSMIQDNRAGDELVMVFWLSPPMVDDKDVRSMLEANLVVGVLDAHFGADGKASFATDVDVTLKDSKGNALRLLKDEDIAPTLSGGLHGMEATFRQALGPVGQGFHWLVFDGAGVHACAPGSGFTVQYAGTTYTYDTPIPGCPKD